MQVHPRCIFGPNIGCAKSTVSLIRAQLLVAHMAPFAPSSTAPVYSSALHHPMNPRVLGATLNRLNMQETIIIDIFDKTAGI